MTTILQQDVESILHNYADVIEGGNGYRGTGTARKGVPGTKSYQPWVLDNGTGLSGSDDGTTTTVRISSIAAADASPLVTTDTPPFFLVCTAQATNTRNVGAARKITAHDGVDQFTVDSAFPEATDSADTWDVREGFKRAPDNWSIEDLEAGTPSGFDRSFSLSMMPGRRLPWHGNKTEHYEGQLELRLRLLKHSRAREAKDSLVRNALTLRSVLTRQDQRDGTYTHIVKAQESEPEIEFEDKDKIVVLDRYPITYRVDGAFL